MSAVIYPFPLARRRPLIDRQVRYASEIGPDAAQRHIQQQLDVQAETMRRRGIDEDTIARELGCMEAAIRSQLGISASDGAA
ncbi:DUF6074 family protein [Bradyrhizobium sp. JYMT SZCCT0180]|uniref:DUF6074 family protein n=1 Tax=Bradyrhizobium sp. JYMT SZCCT0180 TaxID=2807666 RepID=UPI001BAA6F85|nr:DUF6074 family protein [Bradyrhizobium sp. JYMT SZCCT0180]MBR1212056.1 hypothetical protein [Bradyrhizobium sp. JYMT SZCCT0180]